MRDELKNKIVSRWQQGLIDQATRLNSKCIYALINHIGIDNPLVSGFLYQTIDLCQNAEDLDNIESMSKAMLDCFEKIYAPTAPELESPLLVIVAIYIDQGNWAEAARYYKRVLEIINPNGEKSDPEVEEIRVSIEDILHNNGSLLKRKDRQ